MNDPHTVAPRHEGEQAPRSRLHSALQKSSSPRSVLDQNRGPAQGVRSGQSDQTQNGV